MSFGRGASHDGQLKRPAPQALEGTRGPTWPHPSEPARSGWPPRKLDQPLAGKLAKVELRYVQK